MDIIQLATVIALFIFLILVLIIFIKISKMKKRYKIFMQGSDAKSLENVIEEKLDQIEMLEKKIIEIKKEIDKQNEVLLKTYQKCGIKKYDAFKEKGGKLSFALAMLDKEEDGFIINSVHSTREGCYIFIKEIIKGKSFLGLSNEEEEALTMATKTII
ncbi:MAG TPA: DUF4446 family protein [Clostridiales bacterium]|nr:DUF4446 family protein [Clostridiales bacterium]